MSQLVETIKCEDGKLEDLKFHQLRFNRARREIFGIKEETSLADIITIPTAKRHGLFRCRVVYSLEIEKVEFIPHQYRPVKRLRIVHANDINYNCKFTDRRRLDHLFEQRGTCDDIIIVRNNCLTDSYTANLILFDGHNWWTPDTPLLAGTQRDKLLNEEKIFKCRISLNDLSNYTKIGLINAMQDLETMPIVDINYIEGS